MHSLTDPRPRETKTKPKEDFFSTKKIEKTECVIFQGKYITLQYFLICYVPSGNEGRKASKLLGGSGVSFMDK